MNRLFQVVDYPIGIGERSCLASFPCLRIEALVVFPQAFDNVRTPDGIEELRESGSVELDGSQRAPSLYLGFKYSSAVS